MAEKREAESLDAQLKLLDGQKELQIEVGSLKKSKEKLDQLSKFTLPYKLTDKDFTVSDCRKVTQESVQFVKEQLVECFQSKASFHEIASHITDQLDKKLGGFWLCQIKPNEIEVGIVKSEYKHIDIVFTRDNSEYQIYISQTNKLNGK